MHGLHAAEAIKALQQHLQKIESQFFSKGSASSNGQKEKDGIIHSNFGSTNWLDKEKLDKRQASSRLRSSLHVITGILVQLVFMYLTLSLKLLSDSILHGLSIMLLWCELSSKQIFYILRVLKLFPLHTFLYACPLLLFLRLQRMVKMKILASCFKRNV